MVGTNALDLEVVMSVNGDATRHDMQTERAERCPELNHGYLQVALAEQGEQVEYTQMTCDITQQRAQPLRRGFRNAELDESDSARHHRCRYLRYNLCLTRRLDRPAQETSETITPELSQSSVAGAG